MSANVVDAKWYTSGNHTIGIVLIDSGFGHKAYLGLGYGLEARYDEQHIVRSGARFPDGPKLWPNIAEWAP